MKSNMHIHPHWIPVIIVFVNAAIGLVNPLDLRQCRNTILPANTRIIMASQKVGTSAKKNVQTHEDNKPIISVGFRPYKSAKCLVEIRNYRIANAP